jgi:hypothetical protein
MGGEEVTPLRGAAGTSDETGRLVLLDVLRAVALYRVVLLHVSGVDLLAWISAMPVMFFVAGSLTARSLDKRPGPTVIRDRYRRILLPLAAYAAFLVALYWSQGYLTTSIASAVTPEGWISHLGLYDTARLFIPVLSLGAPVGPGAPNSPVYWTWVALWYVHTHLVLILLAPLLRAGFRRQRALLVGAIAVLWILDLAVNRGEFDVVTFLAFFVAGFAFNDGIVQRIARRRIGSAAVVCAVAAVALVPLSPGLPVNWWGPSLLLLGVAWLGVALYLRGALERFGRHRLVRPVLEFTNRRALTIYLWSLAGVYVSRLVLPRRDASISHLVGVGTGSVLLTATITVGACVLFGWIEDLAARRPVQFWPTPRSAPVA